MKNQIIYSIILGSLILSSCNKEHKKEHKIPSFTVVQPVKKDTILYKEYVAQIKAHKHIELRAIEQGYLSNISVDEGSLVRKGALMFTTLPSIYQAELNKSTSEARVAEIEYSNSLNLFKEKIISENELALYEAEFQKAKAEVSLAQTHLNFTQIKAPFDGIMDRLLVREGSLLDEGEILTSLSDNSIMWVYFNVPEAEYLDYIQNIDSQEKEVELKLPNGSTFNERGHIETILGDFDNTTGTIGFRASFKNPKRILRHGETGIVRIPIHFQNALLIPQKATFQILDKTYVFVVNNSGQVIQKEIETDGELSNLFIVKEGLSINEIILVDGIRMVRNNDFIHPKKVSFDELVKGLDLFSE